MLFVKMALKGKTLKKLLSMITTTVFLFATSSVSANLITNSGFETGDLTGWSCTGADSCGTPTWATPHSGAYAMGGFDNLGFGTLSQSITTVIGQTYDFSFFSQVSQIRSGNILRYQIDSLLPVLVSSTTSYDFTSTNFTATSAMTSISYLFETDPGTGTWDIDDVSVVASESVPEPATLALMGLGLAGIGWKRRKAA